MKMICPKAKRCEWAKACDNATPHNKNNNCGPDELGYDCPACVPVKAKRKGKK